MDKALEARAYELLLEDKRMVTVTAAALRYRSTSSFVHAFRRWTGLSPTAFRKHRGH